MSLESNQQFVDSITLGAEQAAAGKTLGLTADQTLDFIKGRNDRLREAQRAQYIERELREGNRAAAEEFLAENSRQYPEEKGYDDRDLVQEDLIDSNGRERPQRYQQLRENAKGKRKAGKFGQAAFVQGKAEEAAERQKAFDFGLVGLGDNAVYVNASPPDERVGTRQTVPVFGTDENGNPVRVGERKGRFDVYRRGGEGGDAQAAYFGDAKAGQRQVVDKLQSMIANGEIGLDDVVGGKRVEEILYNVARHVDPRLEAIKEKKRARELVRQDAPNTRAARENRILANIEALDIKEGDLGVRNRIGRNNLAQMGEIINIGGAGGAGAFSPAQVGLKDDSPAYYDAVRMVGPDGQTVGYANPGGDRFLGDVNLPGTANQVNAPVTPKGVDWVANNYLQYKPNQAEPQVGIMSELRRFTDRLNGLGYGETAAREMRGMDEFENAVDYVVAKAKQKGDVLYSFDTEQGKNMPATSPGVDSVLQKMRYTENEKAALAYALYQLEMSKGNAGNEAFKEKFAKRQPNTFNEDVRFEDQYETPIAKIKNEKVGRGKNRQGVKAELRKLSDPDAAMPFYGAVEGEGAPRARFVPREAYGMANDEIMERYPKYGEDMIGVRDRYQRDVLLGAGPGRPDTFAEKQRQADKDIGLQAERARRDAEDIEIGKQVRLMKYGRNFDAPDDFVAVTGEPGKMRRVEGGKRGDIPRVPSNIRPMSGKQPIQQAAVPSMAPTPGDITGSQPAPQADAGRGGWMGGDNSGRVTNPHWNKRNNAPGGTMPTNLRKELFALPNKSGDAGRRIMGDRTEGYMVAPDEPTNIGGRTRREAAEQVAYQKKMGRRGAIGAAGLAGVGGLAALIGGERDRREEQEQYQ